MTISTNIHLLQPVFTLEGYTGLKVKNILSRFLLATKWKKVVANTMFSMYLSVSFASLFKFLAFETNIFFHGTRSYMFCRVCRTWSGICEKYFLFYGIKIANHRFLVKKYFPMLGKDDQEKGTDLRENRNTRLPFSLWPFWKLFNINTQSLWHAIPPYVPGVNPPKWPLIYALQ